ncbi:hypothetical protein ABFS83_14G074800 [Erythranthe nasuta]
MIRTIFFVAFAIFLQGALGELVCEELPVELCSFSIASSGKRCVLETWESSLPGIYQCKTSEVAVAIGMQGYIEKDDCVSACGVDRNTVGISSDSLMETQFTFNLCSPQCYDNCPNIVDLYYNLALAEGVVLGELCKSQRTTSSRRSAIQLQSSSAAAESPIPSVTLSASTDCAPPPM